MSCVSFKGSAGLFDNFNFSRTVTVNEMKLLLVRSTIAIQNMFWIAICIKSSRYKSKFGNKFEIISSIDPSIFMAPRQQMIIQTQKLDRMRLCFRIKVRFSDALLVSNKMIQRQRMQETLT